MSQQSRSAKIEWFCLRTGSSKEEAEMFLNIAKWKVQNAIDERRRYWKERYQQNREDNERPNS